MKISINKSIEILSEKVKHPYSRVRLAYPDALRLGIEALEHCQRLRSDKHLSPIKKLPSERVTEE